MPAEFPSSPGWASPVRRPSLEPWTAQLWPAGPDRAERPAMLGAALGVGVLAALTIRLDVVGSAYLVTGFCVLLVAFGSRTRRPTAAELVPAVLALALLGVGALRDAPWLVGGCLLGAWALGTLVLLDLLFATFVLVQLTVLFGGREHVLSTQGLTYAEYARQGTTAGERLLVRMLLGVLCLLALVIVASAIHRMSLDEQTYRFTRLRLVVTAAEFGLGGVFVVLLAAGVRMSGACLPPAAVGPGSVLVLVLAAVDPDAYIAGENVTRYQEIGRSAVPPVAERAAERPQAAPEAARKRTGSVR